MTTMVAQCLTCGRFNSTEQDAEYQCEAFTEPIPWPIARNLVLHTESYPGDHGLTYVPRRDATKAIKAIATPRDAAEARLMAALEELFATLAPDIAARLAKGEMPSEQELADALSKVIQPELVKAAVEEYERLGVQVGVQFDPAVVNEEMVAWAQAYTFDLVKGLTDTTRTSLQRAMEQFASTPGMTRGELEALLEPVFGANRASSISVTEITRSAQAAIDSYQADLGQAGVSMVKIFHSSRDEKVCPICQPSDGKPESEWGDYGPPPRHSRCRCWCTLTLEEGK